MLEHFNQLNATWEDKDSMRDPKHSIKYANNKEPSLMTNKALNTKINSLMMQKNMIASLISYIHKMFGTNSEFRGTLDDNHFIMRNRK